MPKTDNVIKNEEIKAKKVMLINFDGKNLGEISIEEALEMADDQNLDLVQVQEKDIPFCKLMDFNKNKYKKQRKSKQSKPIKNKEIRFSMSTAIHDVDVKVNHVVKLLKKGCRIKIVLKNNNRRKGINPSEMENGLNSILEKIPVEFNKESKIEKRENMWSVGIAP